MCEFAVVYSSLTGNTEKIATAIYKGIPSKSKDICNVSNYNRDELTKTFFIGFNVDKGTAPSSICGLLHSLSGKNIALFGTCGYGCDRQYFDKIESIVKEHISDTNNYLGFFMCQGKMPISVRQRYEGFLKKDPENVQYNMMLKNFDMAMLHPNPDDESDAKNFAVEMYDKLSL